MPPAGPRPHAGRTPRPLGTPRATPRTECAPTASALHTPQSPAGSVLLPSDCLPSRRETVLYGALPKRAIRPAAEELLRWQNAGQALGIERGGQGMAGGVSSSGDEQSEQGSVLATSASTGCCARRLWLNRRRRRDDKDRAQIAGGVGGIEAEEAGAAGGAGVPAVEWQVLWVAHYHQDVRALAQIAQAEAARGIGGRRRGDPAQLKWVRLPDQRLPVSCWHEPGSESRSRPPVHDDLPCHRSGG